MALGQPIENQPTGIDAFFQGAANAQGIFNSLMENRKSAAQANQATSTANNLNTITPYDIALKSAQTKDFLSQMQNRTASTQMLQGLLNGGGGNSQGLGGDYNPDEYEQKDGAGNPVPTPQLPPQGSDTTGAPTNITDLNNGGSVPRGTVPPVQAGAVTQGANGQTVQQLSEAGTAPLQDSSALPVGATPTSGEPSTPNGTGAPQMTPAVQSAIDNLKNVGDSAVVTKGDASKAQFDKLAGLRLGPTLTIPKIQSIGTQNGIQFTQYPSGKVVATKLGPSTQETEQFKSNVDQSQTNEESAQKLASMVDDAQKSLAILKRNPNATGVIKGLSSDLHLSNDPDNATLRTNFGNIQAGATSLLNQKGAVGAINWAGTVKPNILNPAPYNIAQLQAVIDHAKMQYHIMNNRNIKLVGKPLQTPLPDDNSQNLVRVKTPDNKIVMLPASGAEQLIKDHPDHKILGSS